MILYHGSDVKVINPEIIERLKFQKINSQIAFRTQKSLILLKFVESYEVK